MCQFRQSSRIIEELSKLSQRKKGLYFAGCSERLRPLYAAFCESHGFGSSDDLGKILDLVWQKYGEDGNLTQIDTYRTVIEANAPHADDFGSVLATFAQDFCICLDCSLCGLTTAESIDPKCAYYAWEPVQVAVTYDLAGVLSLGDADLEKWIPIVSEDPRTLDEQVFQQRLVQLIISQDVDLDSAELQKWCQSSALTEQRLLGGRTSSRS